MEFIFLLLILAIAGGVGLVIWGVSATKVFDEKLKAEARSFPIPSSFQPVGPTKVTYEDLLRFERLVMEISPIIAQGKTEHTNTTYQISESQCRAYLRNRYFLTWLSREHPIIGVILFLLIIPISLVPILLLGLIMLMGSMSMAKIESIFMAYYNGTLIKQPITPSSSSHSVSDELIRLNQLRQQGVLSEDEFQSAKKKVIQGNSP